MNRNTIVGQSVQQLSYAVDNRG